MSIEIARVRDAFFFLFFFAEKQEAPDVEIKSKERRLFVMQNPSFLHFPSFWKNTQLFVVAVVVVSLLILNTFLVIMTGGIPSAFAHTMYIPVLIAAYYLGPIVAAVTGILAGLLVGPAISWDFWGVSSLECQKNSSTRFKESDLASLHAVKSEN